jgi:hypothetical protein
VCVEHLRYAFSLTGEKRKRKRKVRRWRPDCKKQEIPESKLMDLSKITIHPVNKSKTSFFEDHKNVLSP